MKRTKSAELHARAQKSLVGGVNSPVRSFRRVGGSPLLAARGFREKIWDVDGNEYLDFVMSYGPHLFGHACEPVVAAIEKAARDSTCLGMTGRLEIEWAESLLPRFKGAEKVRALSTGTEACGTAVRLARGITGRDLILKFSGHYHGHVDSLLVDAGSGVATLSHDAAPESKGIPKALTSLARICEFNDVASIEDLFRREGSQLACAIIEPIMGNMGVVPPNPAFLKRLRELCSEHETLLILDEVMTGLRVHAGSAQGLYQIEPDLTTLGKIVGGGLPLSALVGPAKFMDHLAPLGPVYQAGTLSGNPLCTAAGLAMMEFIDREKPYAKLEEWSGAFARELELAAEAVKVPVRIERVGSMLSTYFRKAPVHNARDAREISENAFNCFFWSMLEEGFMLPPSPFEAYFVSLAHVAIPLETLRPKLRRVFERVATEAT